MNSLGKTRTTPRRLTAALLAAVALSLLVSACARGTYAVEVFPEMHYNQSTRIQEPPRLSPPDGAVPVTGREVTYSAAEASGLVNPLPRSDDVLARGREAYRVNCSMCHGPTARGDGAVGVALAANGYVRPPNLTAPATQGPQRRRHLLPDHQRHRRHAPVRADVAARRSLGPRPLPSGPGGAAGRRIEGSRAPNARRNARAERRHLAS